jgi:hypothetical protein
MKGSTVLVCVLAPLTALVSVAPAARADSSADYLASLDTAQISYGNATTALNIGNSICQQLRSNAAPEKAVTAALNAGYGAEQAGKFLYISSHTLCPDMGPAVEKWVNTP